MMESATGILIYAELLTNIRRISVGVHLPSRPDESTRAEVVDFGRQLHIYHKTSHDSIELPARVVTSASNAVLPIPEGDSLDFSWRLPVFPDEIDQAQFTPENQAIPWTSVDIGVGSQVECRNCCRTFVREDVIRVWKDLPSENWAEMMEFWHCHKPDEENHDHQDSHALTSKGYGANNAISAQTGVGFVDLTSFLFAETDCEGLTVSAQCPLPSTTAACSFTIAYGGKEDDHVGIKNLIMIWTSIQTPKIDAYVVPTLWAVNRWEPISRERVSLVNLEMQPPVFHPTFQRNGKQKIQAEYMIIEISPQFSCKMRVSKN